MVNFPTQTPDCDSHSPALLNLFLSSDASIYSTMAFPPLGNYDVVVSVSIDFPTNSQQGAPFHRIAFFQIVGRFHLWSLYLRMSVRFGKK